ncbi:hypothetical protein AURDEDRAFT_118252 [Auricularia subglabra TFB-10046 SS5]|nr:hypothetical protein AURDEDRAFT_118252 [Auricularia subglabra TFB-10046 SS5]
MHMLNHYVPGIKLFGALGLISTDVGKRLHIDKLKNLYQLTNKKRAEYPKQICTLLTAKNRMDWLGHYLAHVQGTTFDPRKRIDDHVHEPIEFAKKPAAQLTLQQLADEHMAVGLEGALRIFLQDLIKTEWAQRPGAPPAVPWLSPYMKYPVWHNMKFFTPDMQTVAAKDTRDVAYAVPKRTRAGFNSNDDDAYLDAHFSPVFVKEGGLRVGHLRVIFELPPMIAQYLEAAQIPLPGKLAFVQWFTKLGRRDADPGMFKVSAETAFASGQGTQRVRTCAVIEAIDICRSAYLAPRLGRDTPEIREELTSESMLEDWKGDFWVNRHLDPAMFRSLL